MKPDPTEPVTAAAAARPHAGDPAERTAAAADPTPATDAAANPSDAPPSLLPRP
jgi:hypothetical protein